MMNVLVIGATGYIGSAVCRELAAAGHAVTGLARSEEAAAKLRAAGHEPVAGDVDQSSRVAALAAQSDGVIYAVQLYAPNAFDIESLALRAIVEGLANSGKPFVYTSGAWAYGDTGERVADEDAPLNPPALVARRPELERIALDGAHSGVRASVVRPGDVYGEGRGIPAMLVSSARDRGAASFVGDGRNRWAVVHVEDLARLYVLMFEGASGGDLFNANDETAFSVREMAEAASRGAGRGGAVHSWPLDEARKELGPFADALVLDQRLTSARARQRLGWTVRSTTILDDLERGSYAG